MTAYVKKLLVDVRGVTRHKAEPRLPAVLVILAGIALYASLPAKVTVFPRYVIPVIELAMLIPLTFINPTHFTRETKVSRIVSLALVAVLVIANYVSLGFLVHALVLSSDSHSRMLLLAALEVWLTNIIAFGLAYWELDRGGPVRRATTPHDELPAADFFFPQDSLDGSVAEVAKTATKNGWMPGVADYLYLSVTNSTAFSPTDTMPLSKRAKLLMALQGIPALIIMTLVIARAVNTLP